MSNDKPAMFAPLDGSKANTKNHIKKAEWLPVTPVPRDAPAAPVAHPKKGKPVQIWDYRNHEGRLLGHTWRFDNATGGKEFVYLTWCQHSCTNDKGWRWKAWTAPRPLYGLPSLQEKPGAPVLVVEGEKCVDVAVKALPEWCCITSPGGSSAARKADWTALADREVVIWPDADEPGRKYANMVVRELQTIGADSIAILPPLDGVAGGWDLEDAVADDWSIERFSDHLAKAESVCNGDGEKSKDAKPADDSGSTQKPRRKPQRDNLVDLVSDDVELWCDPDGDVFATIPVSGHHENWPLRSRAIKRWLSGEYYDRHGGAIGGQAMEEALLVLESLAVKGGRVYPTFRRVGRDVDAVYLNLCNKDWQVVKVTAHGWKVTGSCPVKFVRTPAMRALPEPEAGDSIDQLRGFLNVSDDDQFMLIVAWLAAAMWPAGPYPILTVSGEQGSGKSSFSRMLREILDPNGAPIRSAPNDERDLIIAACSSGMLAYDNLSAVQPWLSDALCRLSTGGGFSTRRLHSDREEMIFSVTRPILLNGIPDLSSRPDLADRSISIHLPRIDEAARKTEKEVFQEFEAAMPFIVGALLDGVSAAIRRFDKVELQNPPRMADFAQLIVAASPGLGWEDGQFLAAYKANRSNLSDKAFESDPLPVEIEKMMQDYPNGWEGNATKLLDAVNLVASETTRKSRYWPKTAQLMGTTFRRIAPLLRQRNFNVETGKSGGRFITIYWRKPANEIV